MKKIPKPFKATKKQQEKKLREAIMLLNGIVNSHIAPSPIHGVGIFALRDIKKGEKLYMDSIPHAFDVPYSMFNKLNQEVRDILLGHWPQIVNGSHFLYPVTKMTAFLNHSDEPNYDAKEDKALENIAKGTEITEDYKLIQNYHLVFSWLASGENKEV